MSSIKSLILLVGPKGSGKSYIGNVLMKMGIRFVLVEPIFKKIRGNRNWNDPIYLKEGIIRSFGEFKSRFLRNYSNI
jgi:dephospho-CoA kinase